VVLKVDRFGNLITNITPADAPQLFGATPPAFSDRDWKPKHRQRGSATSYAEGAPGRSVWKYWAAWDFLEVADEPGISVFSCWGG